MAEARARVPVRAVLVPAAIAFALGLAHMAVFRGWIVDDAGISFAYARDLAAGHGLVSQPGAAPVEGFTNLLWVLVLAVTMRLHVFDPVLTPKLLSAACVAGSFLLVARMLQAAGRRPAWLACAALCVTAGTSGFAIWCASGLENALYALLVVALAATVAPGTDGILRPRRAAGAGLLLFLVFCTRPDGALYFWVPPFLLGLATVRDGRRGSLGVYVAAFVAPWLLLTLFRVLYFHDVLPNTFYAKRGEGAQLFLWLTTRLPLGLAALAMGAAGTAVIAGVGRGFHALGRRLGRGALRDRLQDGTGMLFFATAILVHQALPGDWMPQYRFATPAFLLGPAAVLALLWDLGAARRAGRRLVAGVAVAALAVTGAYAARHTVKFARAPIIPFADVRSLNRHIAEVTDRLGFRAAVLSPDVGGALWEDRFRVIDLVGLTDRAFGRDVPRDRGHLSDHVLNRLRPEGVWVHTSWMTFFGFDTDSTFHARYAPVWEQRPATGALPVAGFYLRRDLAVIGPDGLARPRP